MGARGAGAAVCPGEQPAGSRWPCRLLLAVCARLEAEACGTFAHRARRLPSETQGGGLAPPASSVVPAHRFLVLHPWVHAVKMSRHPASAGEDDRVPLRPGAVVTDAFCDCSEGVASGPTFSASCVCLLCCPQRPRGPHPTSAGASAAGPPGQQPTPVLSVVAHLCAAVWASPGKSVPGQVSI